MRAALVMLFTACLLVPAIASAQNSPPIADAGPDQSIFTNDTTLLQGNATDPDNDTIVGWLWSIESAPAGSNPLLSSPTAKNTSFRANLAGDYVISLVVSDGLEWSAPDSVTITVADLLPPVAVAVATPDSGSVPLTVQFDGSQSYDPQGGTLLYSWRFGDQTTGSNDVSPSHTYTSVCRLSCGDGGFNATLRVFDSLGQSAYNVVLIKVTAPGYTPPGTDVVTQPVDGTTGTTPVTLTFENVTAGGTTELTTGDAGPPPPGGFKLVSPPTYFELTTSATYTGIIEVCIDYSNLSPGNENQLKLFHYEDGHWVQLDVTIDIDANVICASVSSLSPFAIFEEISGFGLDIHPRSCPNPFNIKWLENIDTGKGNDNAKPNKGGVMPAAIVGSADFDVTEVDVSTLLLGGVSPIRHSFEDVATPASGEEACECTTAGPDGIMDLCLKFERQEIAEVIGPGEKGDVIELTITGTLLDGTPFEASDCVTIVGNRDELPSLTSSDEVVLKPAVPNPFNPVTRISYCLPSDEFVELSIFDVTGKLVQTLVAKHQAAGDYIIEWNADEIPSGVYFYRLVAGDFVKTRKMVLLK